MLSELAVGDIKKRQIITDIGDFTFCVDCDESVSSYLGLKDMEKAIMYLTFPITSVKLKSESLKIL